VCLCP
jgi:hypothetical protein